VQVPLPKDHLKDSLLLVLALAGEPRQHLVDRYIVRRPHQLGVKEEGCLLLYAAPYSHIFDQGKQHSKLAVPLLEPCQRPTSQRGALLAAFRLHRFQAAYCW